MAENFESWSSDYNYDSKSGEYTHKSFEPAERELVRNWFRETE